MWMKKKNKQKLKMRKYLGKKRKEELKKCISWR
jgi:hypothetical protein